MEKISVIVPAYNAEKYIERCLRSILSQKYADLEVIVVNDGSTDKTAEIAGKIAKEDLRLILVNKQNSGVSDSRNQGMDLATGAYIGFADADDEVEKDMYEVLLKNLQQFDADISHCGFQVVTPAETINFHGTGELLIHNRNEAIKELLSGRKIEPSACNKLYKKNVLRGVYFPADIKVNEDLLFNVLAFLNAEKSVFEDVVKYKYIHNAASVSRSKYTVAKAEDVYRVAKRIKNHLEQKKLNVDTQQFYIGKMLNILQALQSNGLSKTPFAQKIKKELAQNDTGNLGFRTAVLKQLLINFGFLYSPFRFFYDLFYLKNQKWKNH